jgi:hypothetical protein
MAWKLLRKFGQEYSKMIGHVLAGFIGMPDYALWIISGWMVTALLSCCGGYCWALLSHKEIEQLRARIDSLSIADEIIAEIPRQRTMVGLFRKSVSDLKSAIYRLSCQLSESERARIENALSDYQALKIKEDNLIISLSSGREANIRDADWEKVEHERNAMLESLKRLRDEISGMYPAV